jgi:DNA-binding beta-propeller fold protein YncE
MFSKDGRYVEEWGTKGKGESQFNLPHAIVVDQDRQIYVGDRENDRVQVFDPNGKFLAQWKEGGAPYGLFLTADRRLFVADGRASRVTVLDRDGKVFQHWGELGAGPGQFAMPRAVCIDSHGDVYVAEINGRRLAEFRGHHAYLPTVPG